MKFVAAYPGGHLSGAQVIAEPGGYLLEHSVSDRVAHAVVDDLEAVEVDVEQGAGAVAAVLSSQGPIQSLGKLGAVRESGEAVAVGEVLDVPLTILEDLIAGVDGPDHSVEAS